MRAAAHRPILCLAAALVAGAGAAMANSASHREEPPRGIVTRLMGVVFPKTVSSSGITKAFEYKASGYGFTTFEALNGFNVRSSHRASNTPYVVTLDHAPLESPYWWGMRSEPVAEEFLSQLVAALTPQAKEEMDRADPVRSGVMWKALAQRDVFQTYSLVLAIASRSTESRSKQRCLELQDVLGRLFQSLRLDEHEYQQLVALRPKSIPDGFRSELSWTATHSYLPQRVLSSDDTWAEIPSGGRPFKHFRDYGGRSFIKVYIRAPDASRSQILQLWSRLFATYGESLHTSAVRDAVPEGMETMLVRSFGIFLTDGSYRDSFWPEEVIIRAFKYPTQKLDPATSDFRGTQFFQYKMSREALLDEPRSLGLYRVMDDDEQFFGFFGDVPDPMNAYSDTVSTMRSNCIACHSELFYGLNTIFSFERNPELVMRFPDGEHEMLRFLGRGRYELVTPAYQSLKGIIQPH